MGEALGISLLIVIKHYSSLIRREVKVFMIDVLLRKKNSVSAALQ